MKTLEQKIAVMQAALEGKEIEWSFNGINKWKPISGPAFDWISYDYRIKLEKEYVPYDSIEELLQNEHQGNIIGIDLSILLSSIYISKDKQTICVIDAHENIEFASLEYLFRNYVWYNDHSLIGKLKQ